MTTRRLGRVSEWIPLFPLGTVVLPGATLPLHIFEARYRQLIHDVLVGNVPDLGRLAAYRGIDPLPLQAEVARWNQVIADTTARHGDALVDLYARWQQVADHPEYLSADGFHPSSEGYQALADVFGDALRDAGP